MTGYRSLGPYAPAQRARRRHAEAIKRHVATPRVPVGALVIDPRSEAYREEIITKTRAMP